MIPALIIVQAIAWVIVLGVVVVIGDGGCTEWLTSWGARVREPCGERAEGHGPRRGNVGV